MHKEWLVLHPCSILLFPVASRSCKEGCKVVRVSALQLVGVLSRQDPRRRRRRPGSGFQRPVCLVPCAFGSRHPPGVVSGGCLAGNGHEAAKTKYYAEHPLDELGLRTRPPVCSGCDSRHIPAKVSSGEEGRERGEREMSRRGTRRGTDAPGDMLAHAAQIRMLSVCSRNLRLADGRLSSRDFYEVRCSAKLKTSSLG